MRALLIVGNNNLSLRELYTMVFEEHRAGWSTSFMSGMPAEAESIVGGYDAVVYEIGRADAEDRVSVATALRKAGVAVLTHVEGRQADHHAERLQAAGVVVVKSPVSGESIAAALDRVTAGGNASRRKVGLRQRFRRFLGG